MGSSSYLYRVGDSDSISKFYAVSFIVALLVCQLTIYFKDSALGYPLQDGKLHISP